MARSMSDVLKHIDKEDPQKERVIEPEVNLEVEEEEVLEAREPMEIEIVEEINNKNKIINADFKEYIKKTDGVYVFLTVIALLIFTIMIMRGIWIS